MSIERLKRKDIVDNFNGNNIGFRDSTDSFTDAMLELDSIV